MDPWDGKKVSEDSPSWNLLLSHAYDDLVRANKVQTGPLVILHNILTITYLQRGAGGREEGRMNHGLLVFHFPKCKNAASTTTRLAD